MAVRLAGPDVLQEWLIPDGVLDRQGLSRFALNLLQMLRKSRRGHRGSCCYLALLQPLWMISKSLSPSRSLPSAWTSDHV